MPRSFTGWFDVQPVYDFANDPGTIRLESVGEFAEKWSRYAFIDFNGSPSYEWGIDMKYRF